MIPRAGALEADLTSPAADRVFTALADPTRRRVLARLAVEPCDAGAVARDLDLSRQAVAKHVRRLEEAELVCSQPEGRRRVHRVSPERIREISELLGAFARGWDRRLAGIAREAERREADGRGADDHGAGSDD